MIHGILCIIGALFLQFQDCLHLPVIVPSWVVLLSLIVLSGIIIYAGRKTIPTASEGSATTVGSDDSSSDSAQPTPSTTSSSSQTTSSNFGWGSGLITLVLIGALAIAGWMAWPNIGQKSGVDQLALKYTKAAAVESAKMKADGWEALTILGPDEDGFITILPGGKWTRDKTVWFKDFRYTAKKYQGEITSYSPNGEKGITLSIVGQLTLKPLNGVPNQVWAKVQ